MKGLIACISNEESLSDPVVVADDAMLGLCGRLFEFYECPGDRVVISDANDAENYILASDISNVGDLNRIGCERLADSVVGMVSEGVVYWNMMDVMDRDQMAELFRRVLEKHTPGEEVILYYVH